MPAAEVKALADKAYGVGTAGMRGVARKTAYSPKSRLVPATRLVMLAGQL
jgi:hypothetical protein